MKLSGNYNRWGMVTVEGGMGEKLILEISLYHTMYHNNGIGLKNVEERRGNLAM